VSLADVQVETDAIVEFAFLRVCREHALKEFEGLPVLVTLQCLEPLLVDRYRLDVGGPPGCAGLGRWGLVAA
jgi:hypothetical protein